MTESDKINGWTFEETVKTATNLMEVENNMFKWDVLRHLRDFAEMYEEEVQQYRALGNIEELRRAKEKQIPKKPIMKPYFDDMEEEYLCCPTCGEILTDRIPMDNKDFYFHCLNCGQKLDWSDTD